MKLDVILLGEVVSANTRRCLSGICQKMWRSAHLRNEGCRKVHAVDLVVFCGMLRDCENALWRSGDEEACRVDDLGLLHNLPVFRLLHMVYLYTNEIRLASLY